MKCLTKVNIWKHFYASYNNLTRRLLSNHHLVSDKSPLCVKVKDFYCCDHEITVVVCNCIEDANIQMSVVIHSVIQYCC